MWSELELNFCLSAEMWQIILKFIYEHACAHTVYDICMRTCILYTYMCMY